MITPTPGVHGGTSFEDYHRWDAMSNSRLSKLAGDGTPAHLKAYLETGGRTTEALILGRAIHVSILEPDTFDARYVVAEQCTAMTKEKARCSKMGSSLHSAQGWLCGTHLKMAPMSLVTDKEVIAPDDRAVCLGMRDAVWKHPAASALLRGISPLNAEVSLAWIDPDTGAMAKARPDYVTEAIAGGALVDLKSALSAGRTKFAKSIFDNGYHRQSALYLDGAAACGVDVQHFVHIAVEKEYPYAVAVYRMRDEHVMYGRRELFPLKHRYADCVATDQWPAYGDEVEDIELPAWAVAQMDVRFAQEIATNG